MLTHLKNLSILFITLLSCMLLSTLAAGQNQAEWLNDKVTVRFQEKPMSTVLGEIAQQTGIAILYDEKLADQKVTGYYKDVKFSEAINRLFRGTNKSIQVFKSEKKIIIKTFGAKQFILVSSDQPSNNVDSVTVGDLQKLHRQQYKEYKERIADDNEVLSGGMTRGEIRTMHEKQYEELQNQIKDDNEVLDGGMTRGEIRAMHEKQYEELQNQIKDDNEVLDGGMTRGEIRAMHEKQYEELQNQIKDDNEVLDGGMTRGEIRAMHEKQYEELQNQ
ncbi:MAG: hypothetical protein QTN59_07060 [Candidatus Electrothrix communis]|nr:MAG: hypothetical protein QTN59_07060 [Candidatus Electrothrix communis]